MTRVLHHLKSNAIAYVALFIALGGTSYAAIRLPNNSVGTRQIRNGAVVPAKLSKSIGGYVADWAKISSSGNVISSSRPRAAVVSDPGRGVFRVSWHNSTPTGCVGIATTTDVPVVDGASSASVSGLASEKGFTRLLTTTFDSGGNNVPENVDVIVVCR